MANTKPSAERLMKSDGEKEGSPKKRVTVAKAMQAETEDTAREPMAHCQADALPKTISIPSARAQRKMLLNKMRAVLNFIFSKV